MSTSLGHDLDARDPEQPADMLTDAQNIITSALKDAGTARVSFDNDVLVELDGDDYRVTVPYALVRVKRSKHCKYPDRLAQEALEEVALAMLSASRGSGSVWRDMQRATT